MKPLWATLSVMGLLGLAQCAAEPKSPATPTPVDSVAVSDVFVPDLVALKVPERTINEYNYTDRIGALRGAWHPSPTWDLLCEELKASLPKDKVDYSVKRQQIIADAKVLSKGIVAFDPDALLGSVACVGGTAFSPFPTLTGATVGAGRLDKGKMVLLTHNGLFNYAGKYPQSSTAQFMKNLLTWSGTKTPRVASLNVGGGGAVVRALKGLPGYEKIQEVALDDLTKCDILLTTGIAHLTPADLAKMEAFVRNGGLLVVSETAWYAFYTQHPDHYVPNQLTSKAGLWFISRMPPADRTILDDDVWFLSNALNFSVFTFMVPSFSRDARLALCRMAEQSLSGTAQNPETRMALIRIATDQPLPFISRKEPLNRMKTPEKALIARAQSELIKTLSPDKVPVHPSAADWPGLVDPTATRISRTLDVKLQTPPKGFGHNLSDWHTWRMTGLYAPAGQPITITIPDSMKNLNLQLAIGCHVDVNYDWQDEWTRFPEIFSKTSLTQIQTTVASPFGGIVSVLVPPGMPKGTFQVTIDGAVEAPFYVYGKTSNADWLDERSKAPGAWGYIESDNVITFAKGRHLQALKAPEVVAQHWYNVIHWCDYICGIERIRPEMIVSDRQITVGYGHAGYPAMMCYDESDILVNPRVTHEGDWGFYHELGHGYQNAMKGKFTLAKHAEVDVNLFPYIVHEKIHGDLDPIFLAPPHYTVSPSAIKADLEKRDAIPKRLRDYDKLGVASYYFYWQLKAAFGWDLFAKTCRAINADPDNQKDAVSKDFDRNTRFLYLLCLSAQRNFMPYFEDFGFRNFPESFQNAVKDFPEWRGNTPIVPPESSSCTLKENVAKGTLVTRVNACTEDPCDHVYYRILSGNEDGAFRLNPYTGEIFVENIDFERKASYCLVVEAHDADLLPESASCTVDIAIENVNEPPRVIPTVLPLTGAQAGVQVGTPSIHVENTDSIRYQIVSGNESGLFRINELTGMLTLVADVPTSATEVYVLGIEIATQGVFSQKAMGKVTIIPNCKQGVRARVWFTNNIAMLSKVKPNLEWVPKRFSWVENQHDEYIGEYVTWFRAPKRGTYQFYVTGDDLATLYLSTDSNVTHTQLMAQCPNWAKPEEFTKFASQKTREILLDEGELYAIRVIHVEHSGMAQCGVGIRTESGEIAVLQDHIFVLPDDFFNPKNAK